jgi:TRAP-type C4-dicarboxylate transport system permease small subunit
MQRAPDRPHRIRRAIGKWDELLLGVVFILMSVVGLLSVVMRYVFKMPLTWTDECNTYLLVWLTALGTIIAARRSGHITMATNVLTWCPKSVRPIVNNALTALELCFFGVILCAGTWLAYEVRSLTPTVMAISLTFVYAPVPIAALAIMVYVVRDRIRPPAPVPQITEGM